MATRKDPPKKPRKKAVKKKTSINTGGRSVYRTVDAVSGATKNGLGTSPGHTRVGSNKYNTTTSSKFKTIKQGKSERDFFKGVRSGKNKIKR